MVRYFVDILELSRLFIHMVQHWMLRSLQ